MTVHNLEQHQKIELIKNYLSFIESNGSQYDIFLNLLVQVRALNQAVCDIWKASEALDIAASISTDLFKVINMEIGEFVIEEEYAAGAFSYLEHRDPAHSSSPDYYYKVQKLQLSPKQP